VQGYVKSHHLRRRTEGEPAADKDIDTIKPEIEGHFRMTCIFSPDIVIKHGDCPEYIPW
jgi:hypothetical protein